MKTIVSVAQFRIAIRQALDFDAHAISYKPGNLHFITKEYDQSFDLYVHKDYKSDSQNGVLRFQAFKMVRLFDFLTLLEDQPICLEIDDDDIQLSQFIKRF